MYFYFYRMDESNLVQSIFAKKSHLKFKYWVIDVSRISIMFYVHNKKHSKHFPAKFPIYTINIIKLQKLLLIHQIFQLIIEIECAFSKITLSKIIVD